MNLISLITDLGDDTDLLMRSDQWLEEERKSVANHLDQLAMELRAIQTAQKIKRQLQQSNLVTVQSLVKDTDNNIVDVIIRIMPITDAVAVLKTQSASAVEVKSQLSNWTLDGYDVNHNYQFKPNAF